MFGKKKQLMTAQTAGTVNVYVPVDSDFVRKDNAGEIAIDSNFSSQSFWKASGLPEQFRAHRAISRRRSWSIQRCRAVSEPSSSSKSMWGAPDQLPVPISTA